MAGLGGHEALGIATVDPRLLVFSNLLLSFHRPIARWPQDRERQLRIAVKLRTRFSNVRR